MKTNKLFVLVIVLALMAAVSASPAAAATKPASVNVQLLAINDFHGALDPSLTKPVALDNTTWYYRGGAEYLANFVNTYAALNPNTVKISAGDMIGASPLLSALFHDEPTVMAFNLMGFDFNVTGNHEYDEGWHELLRMQNGGCNAIDDCFPGVPAFTGATFEYLAGNVIRLDTGETLFPAYAVRQFNGVKVGFIGIALDSTPTIVVPSGVEELEFQAEVATINQYVKLLKDTEGLKAIVVMLHDGASAGPTINSCNTADPFFANVVKKIDPEVDALITGHSHNAYNCQVQVRKNYAPMLVTSAGYNGRYMTDINLTINATNDQVTAKTATNVPVETPYLTAVPNADMTALLAPYRAVATVLANRLVGSATGDLTRTAGASGEENLGDVIADAQLADTAAADRGGAVIGITNPGGIRADILYNTIAGGELPGQITYGEAFAVQPFSNNLVTLTLTGADIKNALEQQFVGCGAQNFQKILQVSAGFTYTWTASAPACSKVSNIQLNGVAIDPAASYRVTVNNFLAGGGDNFPAFKNGTNALIGRIDLDAFVDYLGAHQGLVPPTLNRITFAP